MKKKLSALVYPLILAGLSITAMLLHPSMAHQALSSIINPNRFGAAMESFYQQNLPLAPLLRDLYLQMKITGGAQEFDGIVLANNGLIENFSPSQNTAFRQENTAQIRHFAESCNIPTYLMILPTACAIYQEQLPSRLTLYNQKRFIEETYRSLAGTLTAIDVYPALYTSRTDYLYYRSDNRLTALGGYTIYQTLAARLGLTPYLEYSLERFYHDFYGNLYDRWGYGGVCPDIITLYHNQEVDRSYRIYHWDRYEERTYYGLYPSEATQTGNLYNIILGGHSPRIELYAIGAPRQSLLLLGDETTFSYLPLLAPHYSHITYLDLNLLTRWEIEKLSAQGYDQVLFTCGLGSYLNTDIFARAQGIQLGDDEERK